MLSSVDYVKTNVSKEEFFDIIKDLENADIQFEYEITNLVTAEECKTIGYQSGLNKIDMDANQYIAEIISPDVQDWYVVEADEIYENYTRGGLGTGYTFVVYQLNDKWYVYHPKFTFLSFSKGLQVDFQENNLYE